MALWWLEPERWHALLGEAGFAVEHVYGWFDRRPYLGGEDTVCFAARMIAANCEKFSCADPCSAPQPVASPCSEHGARLGRDLDQAVLRRGGNPEAEGRLDEVDESATGSLNLSKGPARGPLFTLRRLCAAAEGPVEWFDFPRSR